VATISIDEALRLGVEHHQAGRLAEAEGIYRQILTVNPRHADALHLMGVLAHQAGKSEAAVGMIRRAIEINPGSAVYYSNLGEACRAAGRIGEAVEACRKAVEMRPDYARGWGNLGAALYEAEKWEESLAACRRVVELKADYPEALNQMSVVQRDMGKGNESFAASHRALALRPDYAEAYVNLGNAVADRGEVDEAISLYRKAIQLKPQLAEAHANMGVALKDRGELGEAVACYRKAMELRGGQFVTAHSALLCAMYFDPAYSAGDIYQEHRRWNLAYGEPLKKFVQKHENDRDAGRRLRVGYVSPDFRQHSVGTFMLPLMEGHDRSAVEVFAYAHVRSPDAMTEKFKAAADQWRDIVGVGDEALAERIREDRIDILLDLTLHLDHNRLLAFARKPAPVQVTYLAYPGTSGLTTMDWRITDPYLDPVGSDEGIYSERSWRLPETYWCYRPMWPGVEVNDRAVAGGEITFGCLNNFSKVTSGALEAWGRVMRQLPGSRLILYAMEGSHRQRVKDVLAKGGVEQSRVSFVGRQPLAKYYGEYQNIDIALDPFPYCGGTTTCDALWMGVPVVSLRGRTAVGRGGVSLLSNLGLGKLVAESVEEYVEIAIGLARDRERMAELRRTLRGRMEASVVMDVARFARHVEEAYRGMWREWCGRGGENR